LGLQLRSVSGVKEMVVAGAVTITSVAVAPQLRARARYAISPTDVPGAELRHPRAVAEDLDLACAMMWKVRAFLALAVHGMAEREALPLRAVHHFPQLDIAEAGEERRGCAAW
jgi:hypothetical protein